MKINEIIIDATPGDMDGELLYKIVFPKMDVYKRASSRLNQEEIGTISQTPFEKVSEGEKGIIIYAFRQYLNENLK